MSIVKREDRETSEGVYRWLITRRADWGFMLVSSSYIGLLAEVPAIGTMASRYQLQLEVSSFFRQDINWMYDYVTHPQSMK